MKKKLVFLAFLLTYVSGAYAEDAYIVAEVGGLCSSWEASIYQSGYMHVKQYSCDSTDISYRLYQISKGDLKKIEKTIFDARFKSLPDSIEPESYITDEAMFFITLRTSMGKKIISAQGLERAKEPDSAQRFQLVWNSIKSVIPEKE